MDRPPLSRIQRTEFVDWLADYVDHAAQSRLSYGYRNRTAKIERFHAAHDAFGSFHGNAANAAFS